MSDNITEREELLPCPFCGGTPSTSKRKDESLWSHAQVTWYRVYCAYCDVRFDSERIGEAAAKWNTRKLSPLEAAASKLLEALQDVESWHNDNLTLPNWLRDTVKTAILNANIVRNTTEGGE